MLRRRAFVTSLVALFALALPDRASAGKIYVLKYGESRYKASLVNTQEKTRLVRLNWLFYVIEQGSPPHYTLIDTGFSDAKARRRFALTRYTPAEALLDRIGLKPAMIHQVILTHAHFDHAGNAALFGDATITLHDAEYAAIVDRSLNAFLTKARARGRLNLISGDKTTLGDFELIHTGGHTPGSIAVKWVTLKGSWVFTGDECYFAAACRAGVTLPKASAHSPARNADFIRSLNGHDHLLTGHETHLDGGRWLSEDVYLIETQ